jgi:amino acid transporter
MAGTEGQKQFTTTQAAFIGVGSMVGAGIFALLGAAGEVAGAAVWVSFLLAGAIAGLQGYSFAKLGTKFPSSGGMLEYLSQGFGRGHITGVTSWLLFAANGIVCAMVAVSFGHYASSVVADQSATWAKAFSCLVVVAMATLHVVGSQAVARVQTVIVNVVIAILAVFAVVTIANMEPSLLAPSGYPGLQEIVSSIALTFFAFLGFGVVTFTAKDLPDPARQLPRAMALSLAIATTIYVGVALGVFGTLTVDEVIASGGTALAEAAKPTLGDFGYTLMVVTALFSTTGAVNSALYPSIGLSQHLAGTGQFPPLLGRSLRVGGRQVPNGLIAMATFSLVLVLFFGLNRIASLGSAVALIVFSLVTSAHFRLYRQTGANVAVLVIALLSTVGTLVVFCATTLADEPVTALALLVILVVSTLLDLTWTHRRDHGDKATQRPA